MSGTTVTVWSKLPCQCGECTRHQVFGCLIGGLRATGKILSCHRFLRDTVCMKLVSGRRRLVQVRGFRLVAQMKFVGIGFRGAH